MAKIKKLSYSDIRQVKKLISVVSADNIISYRRLLFLSVPVTYIQNFLYNVHFRKAPETYVILDKNKTLKGVISVKSQPGNPYKWQIKRLFLDKSSYNEGKQLVDYIIAKLGARGVDTFYVSFDNTNTELTDLFVKGCSFRTCASESIWLVPNINFAKNDINDCVFRPFKNNDAQIIADLFNENLITLYKYSLQKRKEEFFDRFFQGFNSELDFKFIVESSQSKNIVGFLEIKTIDNESYFVDIIISNSLTDLYPSILSFAIKNICKRTKKYKLYIKNRKYLQNGDEIENLFKQNDFEQIQNNVVLVRDFFKTTKQEHSAFNEAVIFSKFEI